MAVTAEYLTFVTELFETLGEIRTKRMFGGAGVYCDDLFFAVVDDEQIFLKVDTDTKETFEAAGLAPFTFEKKDGEVAVMNYYAAPEDIYDDPGAAREWAGLALGAARRAAAKKSSKKRPPKKRRGKAR